MNKYWFIKEDFLETRKRRIGASDIPALIPNPEKPTQTLAGYDRTPVTVWQEKTGRTGSVPAGLPAEMGHYLEPKAAELFIREVVGRDEGKLHMADRLRLELARIGDGPVPDPQLFQSTPFLHETQIYTDAFIAHPDVLYDPERGNAFLDEKPFMRWGLKIDLSKPFIIECKSANYWSAKRRKDSLFSGYDFDDPTWHGIPLAHYFQIQWQLFMFGIDVAYLALLSNTSEFAVWRIVSNDGHRQQLIDIAGKLAHFIKTDTQPRELAINQKDIKDLYDELQPDFSYVQGWEKDEAHKIAERWHEADRQEKLWKGKKADAADAMAVLLKDRPELRDENGIIAKWQIRKGSERVALSEIRKNDPTSYRYLKRKKLISTSKESRTVKIGGK